MRSVSVSARCSPCRRGPRRNRGRAKVCPSSTVITPSLPTLLIASAMVAPSPGRPTRWPRRWRSGPCSRTRRGSSWGSRPRRTFCDGRFDATLSDIGLAPAATFFSPRGPSPTPTRWQWWCRHRQRPQSVFLATSLTSSAPMRSKGSSRSISLAIDAVVRDGGGAPLLLGHSAALRAEGHAHGISQLVQFLFEATASLIELNGSWPWFLGRACVGTLGADSNSTGRRGFRHATLAGRARPRPRERC